jgi:hypothetical protein
MAIKSRLSIDDLAWALAQTPLESWKFRFRSVFAHLVSLKNSLGSWSQHAGEVSAKLYGLPDASDDFASENCNKHGFEYGVLGSLRRCNGICWLGSALLPSQARIVERDDVVALGALLAPLDHHNVEDDLRPRVEDRATVRPFPVPETHMLPNAHSSVHSHRPLPLVPRFERIGGKH